MSKKRRHFPFTPAIALTASIAALSACAESGDRSAPTDDAPAEVGSDEVPTALLHQAAAPDARETKPAAEAEEEAAAEDAPQEEEPEMEGDGVKTDSPDPEKDTDPETTADPSEQDAGNPLADILGVDSPTEEQILWTAYYIAPVSRSDPEEGRTLQFTDLSGRKLRYSITGKSFRRAEMEAVATGLDKDGHKRFGYRVSEGVWRELPEGSMGMGNKMNALVPLVHIAADQSTYPYGSLVHVPAAEGFEFSPGKALTGYFWVADSGGRIEGDHFDLFVGEEEVYSSFIDTVKHQHHETTIYPIPSVEAAWNPRNNKGLARVLAATGHLDESALGDPASDEVLREAVVAFQKDEPLIPEAEYGDPDAATTLWFLVQAALEAKGGQDGDESDG